MTETATGENLFSLATGDSGGEIFRTLLQTPGVRIEKIVSTGQSSPDGFWYDQAEEEWVAVLQGEAELEYADGGRQRLRAGEQAYLPAHWKHRVAYTKNPTIWLAVFFASCVKER